MTISVREYQELQKDVPQLQKDLAKEDGAAEQISKSLFEEHGVKTLEEVKALKAKTEKELAKLKEEVKADYQAYLEQKERMEGHGPEGSED